MPLHDAVLAVVLRVVVLAMHRVLRLLVAFPTLRVLARQTPPLQPTLLLACDGGKALQAFPLKAQAAAHRLLAGCATGLRALLALGALGLRHVSRQLQLLKVRVVELVAREALVAMVALEVVGKAAARQARCAVVDRGSHRPHTASAIRARSHVS